MRTKPVSRSRRLHAGRQLGHQQAPPNPCSQEPHQLRFRRRLRVTARRQRFTHARLLETHLTKSRSAFCPNAHHQGFLPSQLGVVWNLLLQADSRGPSPISDKAFTAHDVVAIEIFAPQSEQGLEHLLSAPPLPQQHCATGALNPDIEGRNTHGFELVHGDASCNDAAIAG
jgi:hypothetical protein